MRQRRRCVSRAGWVSLVVCALAGAAHALTVEECIETALDANPDLQAVGHRLAAAEALAQQADAAYYPWLGASLSYARTDNAPQAFMMLLNQRVVSPQSDFNQPGDVENVRGEAAVRYRLYDGGRRRLDLQMARLGTKAAAEQRRTAVNTLVFQVTRAFYSVLQGQAFAEVQAEAAHTLEESLRVANERFKAGSAVPTDVLNLEVQLAQAREDGIRARHGVLLARAALNTAIGAELATTNALTAPTDDPAPPPKMLDDPSLVDNRPELRAAQQRTLSDKKNWRRAWREYWPTVSAFGAMDWDSESASDFEQSYAGGVVAEWELFAGFSRWHGVSVAKAQWHATHAEEQQIARQLQLDLTEARLRVTDAWERLQVARKTRQTAEEALRIARERYQQGAAELAELLTAQTGLTATRSRAVAALYDYHLARVNWARARGELAERYAR